MSALEKPPSDAAPARPPLAHMTFSIGIEARRAAIDA